MCGEPEAIVAVKRRESGERASERRGKEERAIAASRMLEKMKTFTFLFAFSSNSTLSRESKLVPLFIRVLVLLI